MKNGLLVVVTLFLSACATTSGYKQFYTPYVDARTLPDVELLNEGSEPQIYGTDNLDRDVKILRSKRYLLIGYSSFNGEYEDAKYAAVQAKTIGSTIVLTNSEYTNTQTSSVPMFLPNNQTTYHSGSVYGSGIIGSYNGTSTTYGTSVVPITTTQRRYDQIAAYFVKDTKKLKFGIGIMELTPDQRVSLERNTGALIDIVYEDSPAFYANVIAGDVITEIDGVVVKNPDHADDLLASVPKNAKSSILKVLRSGIEKEIKIEF